jgi:hypothetical protein
MTLKTERILQLWDEVDEWFPDKSTEFLMEMVCDRFRLMYHQGIDHGDVSTALVHRKP